MKNIVELLFLKEISGVGPARIIKHYLPELKQGMGLEDLVLFFFHAYADRFQNGFRYQKYAGFFFVCLCFIL